VRCTTISKRTAHVSTFLLGLLLYGAFLIAKWAVSASPLTQTQLLQRVQMDQDSNRFPIKQITQVFLIIITTDNVVPQNFLEKTLKKAENLLGTISYLLLAFLPYVATVDRKGFLIVNVVISVPTLFRLISQRVFPNGRQNIMPCLWLVVLIVAILFCGAAFVLTTDVVVSLFLAVTLALQAAVACEISDEFIDRIRQNKTPRLPPSVQQLQQA
ncbi:hypothetical protein PFISCL1PPCAC_21901, partial [Pristionchus fissidentatus]